MSLQEQPMTLEQSIGNLNAEKIIALENCSNLVKSIDNKMINNCFEVIKKLQAQIVESKKPVEGEAPLVKVAQLEPPSETG